MCWEIHTQGGKLCLLLLLCIIINLDMFHF